MTRDERRAMKREMAERRAALKEELNRRRAAARAELDRKRAAQAGAQGKEKKPETRRHRWLLLLLVLLLLFLHDCRCDPDPEHGHGGGPVPAAPEPEPPEEPLPPLPSIERVARQDRPEYAPPPPKPLPWIAAFRLQVAARSPRLATCFVEAERPGMLRWSSSVDPTNGVTSQHVLEPHLQSDSLTKPQRECVLGVLTEPPYALTVDGELATPKRVGMVIEF